MNDPSVTWNILHHIYSSFIYIYISSTHRSTKYKIQIYRLPRCGVLPCRIWLWDQSYGVDIPLHPVRLSQPNEALRLRVVLPADPITFPTLQTAFQLLTAGGWGRPVVVSMYGVHGVWSTQVWAGRWRRVVSTAKPRYNEPHFSEIPAIARWPRYLN